MNAVLYQENGEAQRAASTDLQMNLDLSLALHRAAAAKLLAQPALLQLARQQLEEHSGSGLMHADYADAWKALLAGPMGDLLAILSDPGQLGSDLRSCSPFAGVLTSAERWAIWYQFRAKPIISAV